MPNEPNWATALSGAQCRVRCGLEGGSRCDKGPPLQKIFRSASEVGGGWGPKDGLPYPLLSIFSFIPGSLFDFPPDAAFQAEVCFFAIFFHEGEKEMG